MFILNIVLCYNSLDIIPYVIDYNKKEGIDIFVLDNYSTDGSWEYLQENKIPSERVDTDGAFDLNILVRSKQKVICDLKPDWIINVGGDCFAVTPKPLRRTIMDVEKLGLNVIYMPFIRLFNTGEERISEDPRKVFFNYALVKKSFPFIHKVEGFVRYKADSVILKEERKTTVRGCVLDYGNTRSKEKREEEYRRRQLAWERGLPKDWGTHYIYASRRGWKWNKKRLEDIKQSEYWRIIKKRFGY